jgi:AraC-like DNA-binding protein
MNSSISARPLRASDADAPMPRTSKAAVQRAMEILEARRAVNVTLRELAAECGGYSPTYLLRRFTACTGLTPKQYALRLRVERARTLLSDGMSAAQVALEVGFYDQSHFHRFFRRFLGATPGHYAKGVLEVEAVPQEAGVKGTPASVVTRHHGKARASPPRRSVVLRGPHPSRLATLDSDLVFF